MRYVITFFGYSDDDDDARTIKMPGKKKRKKKAAVTVAGHWAMSRSHCVYVRISKVTDHAVKFEYT